MNNSMPYKQEIFIILICGFFLSIVIYFGFRDPEVDSITEARFIEITGGRGGNSRFVYFVDGVQYFQYTGYHPKMTIGEVYRCYYNSTNPKKSYIDLDKPLFLEGESTFVTDGIVAEIIKRNKYSIIIFDYYVNDVKYQKSQKIISSKNEPINMRVGDIVAVEYWHQDPRRSILMN